MPPVTQNRVWVHLPAKASTEKQKSCLKVLSPVRLPAPAGRETCKTHLAKTDMYLYSLLTDLRPTTWTFEREKTHCLDVTETRMRLSVTRGVRRKMKEHLFSFRNESPPAESSVQYSFFSQRPPVEHSGSALNT